MNLSTKNGQIYQYLLLIVVFLVIFLLLGRFLPVGPDYFFTFRPVTLAFLRGETRLFDPESIGYYNAPWGIFLFAPTLLFSLGYGQAVITLGAIAGLFLSIYAANSFEGKNHLVMLIAVLAAMANLHTFDVIIRGNIDGFLLLGLGLGWLGVDQRKPILVGIGLWLLSIKPLNVILVMIVIFWVTKNWSVKEKLTYMAPLGGTIFLSFLIFGFDWPARYIQSINAHPPYIYLQTSLWRAFAFFGLMPQLAYVIAVLFLVVFGIILVHLDIERISILLAFALAVNLTITPYALGSHYILLAPVFVLLVAHFGWFLVAWFLTLTPLLRISGGFSMAWIDIGYPIAMMVGTLLLVYREAVAPRLSVEGE